MKWLIPIFMVIIMCVCSLGYMDSKGEIDIEEYVRDVYVNSFAGIGEGEDEFTEGKTILDDGSSFFNWDFEVIEDTNTEVNMTVEQISDSVIEITLYEHPDSSLGGGYKWHMALCNISGVNNLMYQEEDSQGGFENTWNETVFYENLIDNGMPESWCSEHNNMGYVLFSSGSKNQLPKHIRLILPNTSIEFTIFAGTESAKINGKKIIDYELTNANLRTIGAKEMILTRHDTSTATIIISNVTMYSNIVNGRVKFGSNKPVQFIHSTSKPNILINNHICVEDEMAIDTLIKKVYTNCINYSSLPINVILKEDRIIYDDDGKTILDIIKAGTIIQEEGRKFKRINSTDVIINTIAPYNHSGLTGNLTVGLVACYNLSSDTTDSYGSYDGTNTGMTFSTGKIGNAGYCSGNDNVIINKAVIGQDTFTVIFWGYAQTGARYYMTDNDDLVNFLVQRGETATDFQVYVGEVATGALTGPLNAWQHIAITHTSAGTFKVYVDNILNATVTGSNFASITNALWLCNRDDLARDFVGRLDEIKIYDYVVSVANISQDYTELASCADIIATGEIVADTTPPAGNLTTITNNSEYNATKILIGSLWNETGDIRLYINWTLNQTELSVSAGTNFTFITNLSNGTYLVNATNTDSDSNVGETPFFIFKIANNTGVEVAVDSCNCPTSGHWSIIHNCNITSDCDMQGNDVHIYKDITIDALIYNRGNNPVFIYDDSQVFCNRADGKCFE